MNNLFSHFELKKDQLVFLVFFGLLWLLGDSWIASSVLIPFFALPSDGCGGDAADGDSSGCGNAGSDNHPSSPFLCTWNGKEFVFENDVLFGHPTSLFSAVEEGKKSYESKSIASDTYRVQNKVILERGMFKVQIKEIEPEESYIDYLSLLRIRYPKTSELVIGSKFEKMHVFEKGAILKGEGVSSQEVFLNDMSISPFVNAEHLWGKTQDLDGYFVDTNDKVYIKAKVQDSEKDLYLIMRSYYRDWAAGELFSNFKHQKSLTFQEVFGASFSPKNIMKGSLLLVSIVMFSVATSMQSLFQFFSRDSVKEGAYTLTKAFGVPRAYADTPRSLVVEYKQGSSFNRIDVVSPRYYQPSLTAVSIPKEAVDENGDVFIRITPTKRHKIYATTLVAPQKKLPYQTKRFEVSKVVHQRENKDYTAIVNKKYSGEYLHTIPGDTVDISFDVTDSKLTSSEQEAYILEAGGVYTPASDATQKMAGDWVSKLDYQSRTILNHLYSLDSKRDKSKKSLVV